MFVLLNFARGLQIPLLRLTKSQGDPGRLGLGKWYSPWPSNGMVLGRGILGIGSRYN